jgi:hypothetical protein
LSRSFVREFAPWGSGLLLGVGLGGILASQTGGSALALSVTCLALGAALLVVWFLLSHQDNAQRKRDERYQASNALDIVFEGDGTPCVYEFTVPAPPVLAASSRLTTSTSLLGYPPRRVDVTGLRLHVQNLRTRRVKQVTVRMRDARRADDGTQAYPYSEILKWMHDDYGPRLLSVDGRTVEPGDDANAYIDFATKSHEDDAFALEFVQPHLRAMGLAAVPTYIHLELSGADEQTGIRVPPCERAFLIGIRDDGGLTASPKRLDECGFTEQSASGVRVNA